MGSVSMWAIKAKICMAAALVHEHDPNIFSGFDMFLEYTLTC